MGGKSREWGGFTATDLGVSLGPGGCGGICAVVGAGAARTGKQKPDEGFSSPSPTHLALPDPTGPDPRRLLSPQSGGAGSQEEKREPPGPLSSIPGRESPPRPLPRTPSALRHFRSVTTTTSGRRRAGIGLETCQSSLEPAPEALPRLSSPVAFPAAEALLNHSQVHSYRN